MLIIIFLYVLVLTVQCYGVYFMDPDFLPIRLKTQEKSSRTGLGFGQKEPDPKHWQNHTDSFSWVNTNLVVYCGGGPVWGLPAALLQQCTTGPQLWGYVPGTVHTYYLYTCGRYRYRYQQNHGYKMYSVLVPSRPAQRLCWRLQFMYNLLSAVLWTRNDIFRIRLRPYSKCKVHVKNSTTKTLAFYIMFPIVYTVDSVAEPVCFLAFRFFLFHLSWGWTFKLAPPKMSRLRNTDCRLKSDPVKNGPDPKHCW